jgi:hypothetical protein
MGHVLAYNSWYAQHVHTQTFILTISNVECYARVVYVLASLKMMVVAYALNTTLMGTVNNI